MILVGACQRSETDMHIHVCVFNLLYLSRFHNWNLMFVYSGFYSGGTDLLS